jgi:general secretion pathway protein C
MKHEAWIELLELALVAALGVGLAQVTWLAIAPRPAGAPSVVAQSAQPQAGALAARQIFGASSGEPTAKRLNTARGLVLLGVLSNPEPGAGRAIVGMQGSRPTLVAPGEPIADGIELREVHPDHVIVMRQGMPERLELERGASRASPPPSSQAPAPLQAPARK